MMKIILLPLPKKEDSFQPEPKIIKIKTEVILKGEKLKEIKPFGCLEKKI